MIDCIINLVGLTNKECACYTGSKPTGFDALNASRTGYFLTDEDYGFSLLDSIYAGIDCGDPNNVYSVLERSRRFAVNRIYTDLQAALTKYYDKTIMPFNGLVGQRKADRYYTASATKVGHLIAPQPIRGAC
jgi:hypothetical protein